MTSAFSSQMTTTSKTKDGGKLMWSDKNNSQEKNRYRSFTVHELRIIKCYYMSVSLRLPLTRQVDSLHFIVFTSVYSNQSILPGMMVSKMLIRTSSRHLLEFKQKLLDVNVCLNDVCVISPPCLDYSTNIKCNFQLLLILNTNYSLGEIEEVQLISDPIIYNGDERRYSRVLHYFENPDDVKGPLPHTNNQTIFNNFRCYMNYMANLYADSQLTNIHKYLFQMMDNTRLLHIIMVLRRIFFYLERRQLQNIHYISSHISMNLMEELSDLIPNHSDLIIDQPVFCVTDFQQFFQMHQWMKLMDFEHFIPVHLIDSTKSSNRKNFMEIETKSSEKKSSEKKSFEKKSSEKKLLLNNLPEKTPPQDPPVVVEDHKIIPTNPNRREGCGVVTRSQAILSRASGKGPKQKKKKKVKKTKKNENRRKPRKNVESESNIEKEEKKTEDDKEKLDGVGDGLEIVEVTQPTNNEEEKITEDKDDVDLILPSLPENMTDLKVPLDFLSHYDRYDEFFIYFLITIELNERRDHYWLRGKWRPYTTFSDLPFIQLLNFEDDFQITREANQTIYHLLRDIELTKLNDIDMSHDLIDRFMNLHYKSFMKMFDIYHEIIEQLDESVVFSRAALTRTTNSIIDTTSSVSERTLIRIANEQMCAEASRMRECTHVQEEDYLSTTNGNGGNSGAN
ncbi:hypothetical protein SNEBB_005558 [Seison nebaliae]|nr:hypothetical protein SNEBB_005558 [Seison nebaliae]